MIRQLLRNPGAPPLWVAAGISLTLHAAIVLSVPRPTGNNGDSLSATAAYATPLMARLATTATAAAANPMTLPPVKNTSAASATFPTPAPQPAPLAPAAASAGTGTLYYFRTSELDRKPFPLTRIEVPAPASPEVSAGAVRLRLRISESGFVEDAKIVFGTGLAEFENAALREFTRARFQPGYRGNLPVRSEMLIEVNLHPPADVVQPQLQAVNTAADNAVQP